MRLQPVVGLVLVTVVACSSQPPTTPMASPTAIPGTLSLSGTIVSNKDRAAIPGATFEVSQAAPVAVTTDAAGRFTVGGLASGMVLVTVSAPGFLTHQTKVNLTGSRTGFVLDLIPNSPPFDLEFYRELARGKFHGTMLETRRWTMNPSFYFQTVTADTGAPVPAAIIDKLERMFEAAVPELTAGMFRVGAFDRGASTFTSMTGWVAVQFFDGQFNGSYAGDSFVGGNVGRIRIRYNDFLEEQYGSALNCGSMVARVADHEIVHAMGYWHTSATYDDFQSGEGCPGKGRPARVLYHAAVMYSRAPGNTDVDTDRRDFAYPLSSVPPAARVSCGHELLIERREH